MGVREVVVPALAVGWWGCGRSAGVGVALTVGGCGRGAGGRRVWAGAGEKEGGARVCVRGGGLSDC